MGLGSHEIALNVLIGVVSGIIATSIVLAYQRVRGTSQPTGLVDRFAPYLIGCFVLVLVAGVLMVPNVPLVTDANGGGNAGLVATEGAQNDSPSTVSARASASPTTSPSATPSPSTSPTTAPTLACGIPSNWPKTPQDAAADFGGQPYDWYPDWYQGENSVVWDHTTWVFQDSPLQPGVTLSADGDYLDSTGTVLQIIGSERGTMWNYSVAPNFPTLHLGDLGLAGRARMLVRAGTLAPHYAFTKRWGYGLAVFPEAEAGVIRIVPCATDQLDAARQASLSDYKSPDQDQGYRHLLWNEGTGQFGSP